MIRGILIVNNQGKIRLSKFYEEMTLQQQQDIIRDCYVSVSKRPTTACNFLEGTKWGGKEIKLIYRQYATLYFIFCVDASESELAILDLIQVFVESIDKVFENVCELDIVFHIDKIYYILEEVIQGGLVLETNTQEINQMYKEQQLKENEEKLFKSPNLEKIGDKIKKSFH
jgi:AP-3 complex subunit sigma